MHIDIQNVSLSIDGEPLVYLPEWKLEGGKMYGLAGKTGSGKSTIGKWLGHVEPIYWDVEGDMEIQRTRPQKSVPSQPGGSVPLYLLQDAYQIFNPFVPVIRHFKDIWQNYGNASGIATFEEIPDIVASLGISDPEGLMKRKAGSISQGEAQRLAFVLGFIRPALLRIYDEVFSNVDVPSSRRMLEYLSGFCQRTGTIAVVISHDVELLQEFTENVNVIRDGELQNVIFKAAPVLHQKQPVLDSPFLYISELSVPVYQSGRRNQDTLCTLPELEIGLTGRVGLFGPSGLGKTTLLKGLLGEHELQLSKCVLHGKKKKTASRLDDLDIRYLPQSVASAFNPASTVRRSLSEIQSVHRVADTEVEELLDLFGLENQHLDQYPSDLSGGEIQRMGIISVLLGRPDLILLDESFSSVDEDTRETVWSVLTALQQEREFAVLVVSHDVEWLRMKMDEVLEVQEGVRTETQRS